MADLIENEPCYIYHVRDYQEHSQIIEALSLNYGALTIMAQGSKRANSPTKGLFQPFIPLKLSLKKSRSELYFLTGYEHAGNGFDFKMPYYFCASYINELLHHLYHNKDSDVALFGSYIETLEAIRDKNGIESHLRNFELTLLRSLGYSLSNCDDEGALLSFKDKYRFCFGLGFVKYDEKLLSYVTSQYKRASSYTSSSYTNGSSSYNSEEDDGMLFSKSKVRGRRLESNVSSRSYGVSHMGFESFQYHNNFDPEQGELLKKYSDYLQDFLGPILNGAQIRDIIERAFALPDAARNAKLLTSSIINKLLNGREVKSRRLYREYVELKIKQKAQIQEQVQAKDANQTSASQEDKQLSNNQVHDSNVTVSAPTPGSDNVFDGALQETNVNTPEAYLNYALQSRAQANNSFIADVMNQEVSQSINGTQPVEVKAPYKRYVAQFAVKAEQASNDYEDIPEFNAVSENNFTVENSNELLINAIATTSDSTAKLETSYQEVQSNLSDFNLDKAAVAKAYDHSVSAQEPELNLHCEAQSLKTNSSTVSPAPNANQEEANQLQPIQDAIEQNTKLAPQETNEQELESTELHSTTKANTKVKAKAKSDSKDSSNSTSKSKTKNADQELQVQASNDALLETKEQKTELESPELQETNKNHASANTKLKAKAKVESKSSSQSASKSKDNSANQEQEDSNRSDSKLEATELNGTTKANTKVRAKANSNSKGITKSRSHAEIKDTTKANTKVKAKAKSDSEDSSKSTSKSKTKNADQELQASNRSESKLEATELNGTTKANTKVKANKAHTDTTKAKANSDSKDSSKSASKSKANIDDQEQEASNISDSKLEATELHGTTKANTKVKAKANTEPKDSTKAKSKDAGESSSESKVLKRSLAKGKIKGPNGLLVAESAEDLLLGKSKNKTLLSGPKSSKNKDKAKVKRNLKDDTAVSNKSGKDKVESKDEVLLQSWLFDLGAGD